LLLAGSALVGFAGIAERRRAVAGLLFAAVCADLLITNGGLNLTMDVSNLTPPAWFTSAAGEQRLYIGGRVRGYMNSNDPDAVSTWQIPAEATAVAGRMELNALLPMAPSGWGVREALSYDLPYLWPASYEATVRRFEHAGPGERDAFLRRSGVRWCVLPRLRHAYSEQSVWPVVAEVDDWNMRVYDCHPDATRAFIAGAVSVAADPADEAWQREVLFDPAQPDDAVRVAAMPAAAGRAGDAGPSSVHIVKDLATEVSLEATLSRAALVVLRDTYDPSWTATVDGLPAQVARANGIYRAVDLPPGRHLIDYVYRPRDFRTGLITTGMTLAGFIGVVAVAGRKRRNPAAGFTLIELMIVIAILSILLAVAFNQYRGMEARGNEASTLSAMRTIAVAQWQFALTCGNTKYATTLEALAQPVPQTGHAFLSPDLAMPNGFEKSGFRFQMTAKPIDGAPPACNGAPVANGYAATADPVKPGVSGHNFYGVNADRVIFTDDQKTFKEDMPETGAPPHGAEVK
jgi:prepilin-type N-terminal cleavage/methylation domain-containing protein